MLDCTTPSANHWDPILDRALHELGIVLAKLDRQGRDERAQGSRAGESFEQLP